MPTVASLLASAGLAPEHAIQRVAPLNGALNPEDRMAPWPLQRAGHRVQGAAERDAMERPPVPGWDPVVRLPAANLADLDPDQIVDRALGQGPDNDTLMPAPAAGQSTPIRPAVATPPNVAPPPSGAAAATTASPKATAQTEGASTGVNAQPTATEHPPSHQVLPPPPNVHPSAVFAIQTALFLDAEAASSYAAALARNGIATRLVEQLDEAGRTWIYVRSPVFTDSVAALAYAETLERKFGLPALLVSEPPAALSPSEMPGK